MSDGTQVLIRPIKPEDERLMHKFHESLSEKSVTGRYFKPLGLNQRTSHERLTRMCYNDYDREIALVADLKNAAGEHELLGVGRLHRRHGVTGEADFAIVISDSAQNKGLGSQLMRLLIEVARAEGLDKLGATMLKESEEMRRVCEHLGFGFTEDGLYLRVEMALK
jgi:acetyltransferase